MTLQRWGGIGAVLIAVYFVLLVAIIGVIRLFIDLDLIHVAITVLWLIWWGIVRIREANS